MSFMYAFLAFLALIRVAVSGSALLAPTAAMGWALSGCTLVFFGCMAWAAGDRWLSSWLRFHVCCWFSGCFVPRSQSESESESKLKPGSLR